MDKLRARACAKAPRSSPLTKLPSVPGLVAYEFSRQLDSDVKSRTIRALALGAEVTDFSSISTKPSHAAALLSTARWAVRKGSHCLRQPVGIDQVHSLRRHMGSSTESPFLGFRLSRGLRSVFVLPPDSCSCAPARSAQSARPRSRGGIRSQTIAVVWCPTFFIRARIRFYQYRSVWPTRARAIRGIAEWIEDRCNRRRRHYSIGHVTPADFEMQYSSQAAEI